MLLARMKYSGIKIRIWAKKMQISVKVVIAACSMQVWLVRFGKLEVFSSQAKSSVVADSSVSTVSHPGNRETNHEILSCNIYWITGLYLINASPALLSLMPRMYISLVYISCFCICVAIS